MRVVVGPGGRVVIPAAYREALGMEEGDAVFMRVEGDELHVVSGDRCHQYRSRGILESAARSIVSSPEIAVQVAEFR